MVQGFPPSLGGSDGDIEVLPDCLLADEVFQPARAQAGIERDIVLRRLS
jgi:hypothetical protein